MEGDDWDLLAVVRSCATASTNSSATGTGTVNPAPTPTPFDSSGGESFVHLEPQGNPFQFPNLVADQRNVNPFQELQEFYKSYFPAPAVPPPSQPPPPPPAGQPLTAAPQIAPPISDLTLENYVKQQQQQQQQEFNHYHTNQLPISPRPRRRSKNQQKRMVSHVTAENLSADLWAWRKYGQKPIKGAPHPRNYYRCSSSKGCGARKQVERSPSDPNIFVVTYSGEHTHPRPAHRNTLAGSTRGKLSPIFSPKPSAADTGTAGPVAKPSECCSPISTSSTLSPTTPLTDSMEDDSVSQQKTNNGKGKAAEGMGGMVSSNDDNDDDVEQLLIPNMAMTEDIFLGLQELGRANFMAASSSFGKCWLSSHPPSPSPLGRTSPAPADSRSPGK